MLGLAAIVGTNADPAQHVQNSVRLVGRAMMDKQQEECIIQPHCVYFDATSWLGMLNIVMAFGGTAFVIANTAYNLKKGRAMPFPIAWVLACFYGMLVFAAIYGFLTLTCYRSGALAEVGIAPWATAVTVMAQWPLNVYEAVAQIDQGVAHGSTRRLACRHLGCGALAGDPGAGMVYRTLRPRLHVHGQLVGGNHVPRLL